MNSKEQKFTALVGKYKSTIYAVCYMFSDNREELDDLFQEVLLRLWTGYDTFRGEADLRTWIYRVSMNCCLNLHRKVKRGGRHVPLSVEMDPYEESVTVRCRLKGCTIGYTVSDWLTGL